MKPLKRMSGQFLKNLFSIFRVRNIIMTRTNKKWIIDVYLKCLNFLLSCFMFICSSHSSANMSTQAPANDVKFFPALIFDGEQLQWIGDRHNTSQQLIPLKRCVIFQTLLNQQVESYLDIANNGTTAIFYCWKVSQVFLSLTCLALSQPKQKKMVNWKTEN